MHRNAVAEMPWVLENTGSFIFKKFENTETFRNLSSLLCNLTYLSLLNSFLFLSRFSVSLKSLDNYFFRWFSYKPLFSRFSVLISYNMWSSNHFSISSCFPCFSGSRFFRVQVFQGLGPGSGSSSKLRGPVPGFRSCLFAAVFEKQPLRNILKIKLCPEAAILMRFSISFFCTFSEILQKIPLTECDFW